MNNFRLHLSTLFIKEINNTLIFQHLSIKGNLKYEQILDNYGKYNNLSFFLIFLIHSQCKEK